MAKKILLFLSSYNEQSKPLDYRCPDGSTVPGIQTNYAPVRYLLRSHPDVSELLCVVTPQAEGAAWENLQSTVAGAGSSARCVKLPFEQNQSFEETILPQVIQRTESGDEILLDTTGGFRNAVLYLVLISRALNYAGIAVSQAVYSSWGRESGRIEDITHLIGLFDLISGMQEMTSFGSAATLRTYYQGTDHPREIDEMLDAMDQLFEDITLCRTRKISGDMDRFNAALQAAGKCGDPMMQALFPAFRKKFKNKLTDFQLVRWCVQSGMLQQAMTIYIERIPSYIMQNILRVTDRVHWKVKPELLKSYQDPDAVQFTRGFLCLSKRQQAEDDALYLETLRNFDRLVPRSGYRCLCTLPRLKAICMDYLYIKQLRNMTNHANEAGSPEQEALVSYLVKAGYQPLEETTSADIKAAILQGLKNLQT